MSGTPHPGILSQERGSWGDAVYQLLRFTRAHEWHPGKLPLALAFALTLVLSAPREDPTVIRIVVFYVLTTLYLATRAPVLAAPAMNTRMLEHEAVQRNLATLASRGVRFVEPAEGYLACGWMGKGRLAEAEVIADAADQTLKPAAQSLAGRRVLVTAGPTYEDLDPVRFVGNRSSGKMGFALAEEATRRGAAVTGPWLEGPQGLPIFKPPYGRLVAIDLNKGEILWKVANGDGPRHHPALKHLNLPPLGQGGRVSPLITKTMGPKSRTASRRRIASCAVSSSGSRHGRASARQ